MEIAFGILAGVIWGTLFAFFNCLITKRAMKSENNNAVLTVNLLRNVLDIAALAAVFFLRKSLPFNYAATLIATAVSLSMLTIIFSYRIARKK